MSNHRSSQPIAAGLEVVELRENLTDHSGGFTAEANENEVTGLVELWVDPPQVDQNRLSAVANLRMTAENAQRLAESLLLAAERAAKVVPE